MPITPSSPPLLVVTGPTGSGKRALALELANALEAEIVSVDSMQVYRGCDIGTAKPTVADRLAIPHHLVDIRDPDGQYSAADFVRDATAAIAEIQSRGRRPLLCGGTGFYLRALLQPQLLNAHGIDETLRADLAREHSAQGNGAMWSRLHEVDSAAANRLHPNDSYRVLRALEIALAPPPPPQQECKVEAPRSARVFGIDWSREDLYARLDQRVDAMLETGFFAELQRLSSSWPPHSACFSAVGYKQMLPALHDPDRMASCCELWKRETRRYAKRQLTWYRHQLEVTWLPGSLSVVELRDEMLALLSGS